MNPLFGNRVRKCRPLDGEQEEGRPYTIINGFFANKTRGRLCPTRDKTLFDRSLWQQSKECVATGNARQEDSFLLQLLGVQLGRTGVIGV